MSDIAVDVHFLAKTLGVKVKDIRPYMLQNWHQQFAARAITDAFRPTYPNSNEIHAEIALSNAESWIDEAYDRGLREGIEIERKEWEQKIRKLFGLEAE